MICVLLCVVVYSGINSGVCCLYKWLCSSEHRTVEIVLDLFSPGVHFSESSSSFEFVVHHEVFAPAVIAYERLYLH